MALHHLLRAFDPEPHATVLTLDTGRDKGCGLLSHEVWLERGEDGLRFREGQANVFKALAGFLPDHHIVFGGRNLARRSR
jgi:hypothetical protein